MFKEISLHDKLNGGTRGRWKKIRWRAAVSVNCTVKEIQTTDIREGDSADSNDRHSMKLKRNNTRQLSTFDIVKPTSNFTKTCI